MDHFKQSRRHRLNADETPIIMQLVWNVLYDLSEDKCDPFYAEQLFRVLYRFKYYAVGRPWYPEFCWAEVSDLLSSIEFEDTDFETTSLDLEVAIDE